eukprot:scaffold140254_cov133-Phaeocystis_antarctica.AAC.2
MWSLHIAWPAIKHLCNWHSFHERGMSIGARAFGRVACGGGTLVLKTVGAANLAVCGRVAQLVKEELQSHID